MAKKKKWDRLKTLKKISREEQRLYGKAGPHKDKREKRQRRFRTEDYLAELEEEDGYGSSEDENEEE
jgi:hypothetical protein